MSMGKWSPVLVVQPVHMVAFRPAAAITVVLNGQVDAEHICDGQLGTRQWHEMGRLIEST